MFTLKQKIGLWRSKIMYYGKPFNRRKLSRFYGAFIQPGDLCFDVGAHVGNRTDAWLSLDAKIIAIEPQPLFVKELNRRFAKYPQVTILDQAVGAQLGKLQLQINSLKPTLSTFADEQWRAEVTKNSSWKVGWDKSLEVELTTLDHLIEKYGRPKFCKIDVEDFEEEVLKGLSYAIPIISFEFFNYTPQRTLACLDLLNRLGNYQYNWSFGESQNLEFTNWQTAKELIVSIKNYKKNNFSGDIYAQLQT